MNLTALRALEDMHSTPQPARPILPAGWPDAAIAAIADEQAANVSRRQLLALGISASAITRAAARRRLHRVHDGVYSLAPPRARPRFAAEFAAVLAGGPGAVLSHVTAAAMFGLQPPGADARVVHVTLVAGRRHSRPGLVVHRTTSLHPADRHRLYQLPVTSPARTVIDLAPSLDPWAAAAMLDRALKRASATKLREALARHPRRPGTPLLLALLDPTRPSADAWSEAERRLLELIRRSGLPMPECNVSIGSYTPDLLWRAQRVIVEYDSAAHHSGPAAVRWDTARHNELTALGYRVIHVTWQELTCRPERILVQVAAALARG